MVRKGSAVYVVRGGVVRMAGVASPSLLANPAKLRSFVKLVPRHGVKARPARTITTASSKVSPEDAIPLAEQQHGAQFAFVCGL